MFFGLGFDSYIKNTVKVAIDKAVAENIKEEYNFLKTRNTIGELTDLLAISTSLNKYHKELMKYRSNAYSKRIQIAADAEIRRVEAFFSDHGDEFFLSEKIQTTYKSGKLLKGYDVPAQSLMERFNKTNSFGEKTTILNMLATIRIIALLTCQIFF